MFTSRIPVMQHSIRCPESRLTLSCRTWRCPVCLATTSRATFAHCRCHAARIWSPSPATARSRIARRLWPPVSTSISPSPSASARSSNCCVRKHSLCTTKNPRQRFRAAAGFEKVPSFSEPVPPSISAERHPGRSLKRLPGQRLHALLNVRLQNAEHRFMTLNRQRQRVQEPLRRVVVHDAPLRDGDRILRHSHRLRIETKVDDQLFRRAGDAAEVCVRGGDVRVIDLNLHHLLRLRLLCRGLGLFSRCGFHFFRHNKFSHVPRAPSRSDGRAAVKKNKTVTSQNK